jgi:hypothetical protein
MSTVLLTRQITQEEGIAHWSVNRQGGSDMYQSDLTFQHTVANEHFCNHSACAHPFDTLSYPASIATRLPKLVFFCQRLFECRYLP